MNEEYTNKLYYDQYETIILFSNGMEDIYYKLLCAKCFSYYENVDKVSYLLHTELKMPTKINNRLYSIVPKYTALNIDPELNTTVNALKILLTITN